MIGSGSEPIARSRDAWARVPGLSRGVAMLGLGFRAYCAGSRCFSSASGPIARGRDALAQIPSLSRGGTML
ncbi:hypothetical protein A8709_22130 [Paenibacillus pectinilyticus]|uniref:Uncharacterized protein n=1 Tax=Paenibacillus pectinilyticus TaxID=512399 RepID=A0A1C0ZR62_9BACL|nr:hypothetical protein A8709_22130 [Paenibacillus pectinilyticus]